MYEMKDEYFTGVAQVDEEHKRLFEIANSAYEVITNEFIPDKYDYILSIIQELKDYTKVHFQHEEEYMDKINYRYKFIQKVQHAKFIAKLEEFDVMSIEDNQEEVLLELIEFLTKWLVGHILEHDKQLGEHE